MLRNSLSLLVGSHTGTLTSFNVTPTGVVLEKAFIVPPSTTGHSNTVRAMCVMEAVAASTYGSGSSTTPAPLAVVFTGGEDGRVCQWVDGNSFPQQITLALPYCSPSASAAATTTPLTVTVFGTRAADPVSDPEDSEPSAALTALLVADAAAAGDDDDADVLDAAAGAAAAADRGASSGNRLHAGSGAGSYISGAAGASSGSQPHTMSSSGSSSSSSGSVGGRHGSATSSSAGREKKRKLTTGRSSFNPAHAGREEDVSMDE